MTPLTVLSVAYPFAPLGFDAAGGAEQILTMLDLALVERGHRSIVIASEGSRVHGTLISIRPRLGEITPEARNSCHRLYKAAVNAAVADYKPDLIHMHGLDFLEYLPDSPLPLIATLHLPIAWYPREIFALDRPWPKFVCVSESQRRNCPASPAEIPVIRNGVPVEHLLFRPRKRNFALTLGRICPEKGLHAALDAARAAGIPLVLAGRVFPYESHERCFRDEILPRLGPQARFIGPIGFARKRRLLAAARCLLLPSQAEETSSLVAMEALASGTPVIAFRRDALAEIVEDGKTGFLVSDTGEMEAALRRAGALRPECCRQAALARFSARRMIASYFRLYRRTASNPHRGNSAAAPALAEPIRAPSPRADAGIAPASDRVEVEEITSFSDWAAIEKEWRELLDRCPGATPFQSPDWLLPWWRHFGNGDPWILCVRRGGRLAGLAPFFIHRHQTRRIPQISLIGSGNSDYLAPPIEPDGGTAAGEAMIRHLFARREKWRVADLQALSPDSPLLIAAQAAGSRLRVLRQDVCPVLALPKRPEHLLRKLPAKMRCDVRRASRSFEAPDGLPGGVRVQTAQQTTLPAFLAALFRLHQSRWAQRHEPGVLERAEVRQFQRDVSERLLKTGVLHLDVLFHSSRPAAAISWMAWRRRAYLYLSGFAPELARQSPGAVLLRGVLERAIAAGLEEADFLRGGEAYKYAWGARDRFIYRIFLSRGSDVSPVGEEWRRDSYL